jgi:MFS family permease
MHPLLDNPIIRREAMPRIMRRIKRGRRIILMLGTMLVVGPLVALYLVAARPALAGRAAIAIAFIYAALTILISTMRSCRAIVEERALQTWDALLMSRLGTARIVLGKLVASLLPMWTVGLMLSPMLVLASTLSPVRGRYDLIVLAYGIAVVASFSFASLGLRFSMRSTNAASAQLTAALVIAMIFGLGGIAAMFITGIFAGLLAIGLMILGSRFDPAFGVNLYLIIFAIVVLLPGPLALLDLLVRFNGLDRAWRRRHGA